MFLVYLSQELHAPFIRVWYYGDFFSGKSSWIVHGTLWCVQWCRVSFSYFLFCLFDVQYNVSILFSLIPWYIYHCMKDPTGIFQDDYFDLFWYRMLCKFLSDMKVMSLFTFLNYFLIFGPILGTHATFFKSV